ncbi:MAG: acyl-CoA dehydrogenase family protein [Sciscionella sp.]|nr:acyl-CoA dehydrogenase family protein [Sciscionella sp.]
MTTTHDGTSDAREVQGTQGNADIVDNSSTADWSSKPTPRTADEWLRRASEVAAILAADAVERERANVTPHAEVALLKDSGLVTLLGPAEHGGGGQNWTTAYQVIREIASGDGSIGQLIGYHYLWAWAARLVATPAQIAAVEEQATRERWFYGGAVNPRDNDLRIVDNGDELVFNGRKSFSTGSKVSDVTVLEGVLEGTDKHIFAIVPSKQPGIQFGDDWDNLGQRLTESGSVTITDVRVPWEQAAGFVDKEFQPRTYNTLNVPLIQLVFTNFYLGIARGALTTATAYTRDRTRPWPYGGDNKSSASEEFYILDTYGDLQSKLWAAEALADRAAEKIEAINAHADTVTAAERGEAAVVIAAAKQRAIEAGLDIGTRIFEVTGARASANSVGLDIFWRNIRTHSLHDPVAYKRVEVGRYALLGELPEPSWYT